MNIRTWTERMMSENGFCEPEAVYMQAEINELREAFANLHSDYDMIEIDREELRAELTETKEALELAQLQTSSTLSKMLDAQEKLAALESQPHSATLHDDGYWTWNGSPPYDSRYAGWRLKVYAAAGAAPTDAWKDAVLNAMADHGMDAPLTDTPQQIVKKLIDMVATMARDPAINAGAAPVPRMTGAALASQEPVAEVLLVDGEKVIDASMAFFDSVELGTKLYAAAGAAPVPEGWQPIETAPKDGLPFRAYSKDLIDLDFNPNGSVECCWGGAEFVGCVWDGQQDAWYGKAISPTHWMLLPAAPKDQL